MNMKTRTVYKTSSCPMRGNDARSVIGVSERALNRLFAGIELPLCIRRYLGIADKTMDVS